MKILVLKRNIGSLVLLVGLMPPFAPLQAESRSIQVSKTPPSLYDSMVAKLPDSIADAILFDGAASTLLLLAGIGSGVHIPIVVGTAVGGYLVRKTCNEYLVHRGGTWVDRVACGVLGGSLKYASRALILAALSGTVPVLGVFLSTTLRGAYNNGAYEYFADDIKEACDGGNPIICFLYVAGIEGMEGVGEAFLETQGGGNVAPLVEQLTATRTLSPKTVKKVAEALAETTSKARLKTIKAGILGGVAGFVALKTTDAALSAPLKEKVKSFGQNTTDSKVEL